MSAYFLDTNVFLRQILNDDPELSGRAHAITRAIEAGTITVWTSDLVIAELVFVLSSKRIYNQPRQMISDALTPLVQLPHLKLARKGVILRAFSLYTQLPIDYIDCYNAALMERREQRAILGFDTDFDRVAGISRHDRLPSALDADQPPS